MRAALSFSVARAGGRRVVESIRSIRSPPSSGEMRTEGRSLVAIAVAGPEASSTDCQLSKIARSFSVNGREFTPATPGPSSASPNSDPAYAIAGTQPAANMPSLPTISGSALNDVEPNRPISPIARLL
jgi:hypothetical protein